MSLNVTPTDMPAHSSGSAGQNVVLPTSEVSLEARLPRRSLLSLGNDTLLRIMSFLSIVDVVNLLYSCRNIYAVFHLALDFPMTVYCDLASVRFPADFLYNGILLNTLYDKSLVHWFPQFRPEESIWTWNILGKKKAWKFSNSRANMTILYLYRLMQLELDITYLVSRTLLFAPHLDIPTDGVRMYEAALSWAQTHIFGVKFGNSSGSEVVSVTSPTFGPPLLQPPNPIDPPFAERVLRDTITALVWPNNINPQCSQWDLEIIWMLKVAFVTTTHPNLLVRLINLQKPIATNPDAIVEQQKYDTTIADFMYWMRQVMRVCPAADIWQHNPDDGQLTNIWMALKEHQGCPAGLMETEEPRAVIESDYELYVVAGPDAAI
ncbi:hypothetical protein ABW21_db0208960 [Orbilia brochopaga]|nr:hypothetical protein ABW21_db0208960 [Drechslerella brochopaga]